MRSGRAKASPALVAIAGLTLAGLTLAGLALTSRVLGRPTQAPARVAKLTRVGGANGPVGIVARPSDPSLYIVEQRGIVRRLGSPEPLLDVRSQVSSESEQGLLGLAFSADGATAYVDLTNRQFDTEIRSYKVGADRFSSPTLLLKIAQPFSNHNGGQLVVDRDGTLWIGMGDGGGAGDPNGNGQNPKALLGKILRIDPHPSSGKSYGIPDGNAAFAGGRAEVWAMGLRNPWRFSIDQPTRTVWIGDVGQDAYEEIDTMSADTPGANFGWNNREALHSFLGGRRVFSAITDPVFEYPHAKGACSVTGGYVYRGSRIPALAGAYVFADYCKGNLVAWRDNKLNPLGLHVSEVTTFGVDNSGELYVASQGGAVYRFDPV